MSHLLSINIVFMILLIAGQNMLEIIISNKYLLDTLFQNLGYEIE